MVNRPSHSSLQFLKLGGSLITDKQHAHTPRLDVLERLVDEIASALGQNPELRLVLAHGSGSFGHVPARKHGTRQGVNSPAGWQGFVEVWREAVALNRLFMDVLAAKNLPMLAFPPLASVIAKNGVVAEWLTEPIQTALAAGLVPVVFGDVIFDRERGGTILSTEDLFAHLAQKLLPQRVLIAGIEPGVWKDYPLCKQIVPEITPANFSSVVPSLHESAATDVTGGMAEKVRQSLGLVQQVPGLEVLIFSGEERGAVARALSGETLGTVIRSGDMSPHRIK